MAGQNGDAGESKRRRRWLLRARRVLKVSRSARTSCSVLAACLVAVAACLVAVAACLVAVAACLLSFARSIAASC